MAGTDVCNDASEGIVVGNLLHCPGFIHHNTVVAQVIALIEMIGWRAVVAVERTVAAVEEIFA